MPNVIEISNLTKNYDDFKLDNISLSVPAGSIMGLIGANGAGKTTLIRLITNVCNRDDGEISIFSKDNRLFERTVKQDMGIVYDSLYFCDNWSIKNCEKAIQGFFASWDTNRFNEFLNKFGLKNHQKIKTLSRGMGMKLMLSIALSHKAKLLILDEPTSGLDPFVRDDLLDVLDTYTKDSGCSVLFSTHITSDLEKIATHITFLHEGRLIFSGTKANFMNKFVSVSGKIKDLSSEQKRNIVGLKYNGHIFNGMVTTQKKENYSNFTFGPLSIEEIMLHIKKGNEGEEVEE